MANAYALTTQTFQQSVSEEGFFQVMQQDKPQYSGFRGLTQTGFRVVANAGQPVLYEYSGSITYDNGDIGQVAATLSNESGQYEIQGINVTITPARLAEFQNSAENTPVNSAVAQNSATSSPGSYSDSHFRFTHPQTWEITRQNTSATDYNLDVVDTISRQTIGGVWVITKPIPSNTSMPQGFNSTEATFESLITSAGGTISNKQSFTIDSQQAASFDSFSQLTGNNYGSHLLVDDGNYYIEAVFQSKNQADLATFHSIMATIRLINP